MGILSQSSLSAVDISPDSLATPRVVNKSAFLSLEDPACGYELVALDSALPLLLPLQFICKLLALPLLPVSSITALEVVLEPTLTVTSVGLSESIVMTTFELFGAIAKIQGAARKERWSLSEPCIQVFKTYGTMLSIECLALPAKHFMHLGRIV